MAFKLTGKDRMTDSTEKKFAISKPSRLGSKSSGTSIARMSKPAKINANSAKTNFSKSTKGGGF